MADGNITVIVEDKRGAEAKERDLWAARGRWLLEKLSERSTPDGRTVLELVDEPIWGKEDGTWADYCAAVDAAMERDSEWNYVPDCVHVWKVTQQGVLYHDLKCSKCGATKRESWD